MWNKSCVFSSCFCSPFSLRNKTTTIASLIESKKKRTAKKGERKFEANRNLAIVHAKHSIILGRREWGKDRGGKDGGKREWKEKCSDCDVWCAFL